MSEEKNVAILVSAPDDPDTAASVTLDAHTSGDLPRIDSIQWSYDDTPIGGAITVTAGGVTMLALDITTAGPGFLNFAQGLYGPRGASIVVTLAAAGSGVHGKLNLQAR